MTADDRVSIHVEPGDGARRVPRLSDLRDLASRLKFAPQDGRIWLDEQRMLLLHAADYAVLRRQLLDTLGLEATRALLTRLGYAAGSRDAALALKLRGRKKVCFG